MSARLLILQTCVSQDEYTFPGSDKGKFRVMVGCAVHAEGTYSAEISYKVFSRQTAVAVRKCAGFLINTRFWCKEALAETVFRNKVWCLELKKGPCIT